ncbi:MAG: hypothetical protein AB8F65_05810 [Woeseiaceae bacterium]
MRNFRLMRDINPRFITITILVATWTAPAMVAGVFGWNSVWGNGSVFMDYLLPLPITGGILHVPSFLVFLALFFSFRKAATHLSWLAPLALAVATAAMALQLDFARVYDWLFTDYAPVGSPFRFGKNPQLLFVTTDALALWLLTIQRANRPAWFWVISVLAPVLVVGVALVRHASSGPIFVLAPSQYGDARGDSLRLIYTNQKSDDPSIRVWLEGQDPLKPWLSRNEEHVAIYFSNSRQQVARRDYATLESEHTIVTYCWFEEDRALDAHDGYYDCLTERRNVAEQLTDLLARQPKRLDDKLRRWRAAAELCTGVSFDVPPHFAIERVDFCRALRRNYKQDVVELKRRLGRDSSSVRSVQRKGRELGFEKP